MPCIANRRYIYIYHRFRYVDLPVLDHNEAIIHNKGLALLLLAFLD